MVTPGTLWISKLGPKKLDPMGVEVLYLHSDIAT